MVPERRADKPTLPGKTPGGSGEARGLVIFFYQKTSRATVLGVTTARCHGDVGPDRLLFQGTRTGRPRVCPGHDSKATGDAEAGRSHRPAGRVRARLTPAFRPITVWHTITGAAVPSLTGSRPRRTTPTSVRPASRTSGRHNGDDSYFRFASYPISEPKQSRRGRSQSPCPTDAGAKPRDDGLRVASRLPPAKRLGTFNDRANETRLGGRVATRASVDPVSAGASGPRTTNGPGRVRPPTPRTYAPSSARARPPSTPSTGGRDAHVTRRTLGGGVCHNTRITNRGRSR